MLDTVDFTLLSIYILSPSFKESWSLLWQAVNLFEEQTVPLEDPLCFKFY